MEELFNDLLDECTQLKALYEGSGGDMPLGVWGGGVVWGAGED